MRGVDPSVSPLKTKPTAWERDLNYFFRTKVIMNCADEFNQELWDFHIPLASQSQPPIWHACNAYAALYRYQLSKSNPDKQITKQIHEESMKQYSSALKCVIQLTRKSDLTVADKSSILVANLLFVCCCLSRGDFDSAMAVISNSINLTQQWSFWDHDEAPTPIPSNLIVLFFAKIGRVLHQSLLTHGHAPWPWKEALTSLQSQTFTSCADACLELEMFWTGAQALIEELPVEPKAAQLTRIKSAQEGLNSGFQLWKSKFDALQGQYTAAEADRARFIILHIRKILVGCLLTVDLEGLELSWDAFNDDFARAALLAESILLTGPERTAVPNFAPMLAKSLLFMAKVCRQPALRRRMVSMLRPQLRRVRILSAEEDYSPTQIIDTIIAVEERGWMSIELGQPECACFPPCVPGQFICGGHRVSEIHVNPRPGKASELCLRTHHDVVNTRPGHMMFVAAPVWT